MPNRQKIIVMIAVMLGVTAAVYYSQAGMAVEPVAEKTAVHAFDYQCGGTAVTLRLGDDNQAELQIGGEIIAMQQVTSASGAKYASQRGEAAVVFWTKDDGATYERSGSQVADCQIAKVDGTQAGGETMPVQQDVAGDKIEGVIWRADTIGGQAVPAGVEVTLELDGAARAGGRSGCNRYGGPYTINAIEKTLAFTGPMVGTEMACEAPAMDVEKSFNETISTVTAYRIENGVLTLLAGGHAVMTMKVAEAAQP